MWKKRLTARALVVLAAVLAASTACAQSGAAGEGREAKIREIMRLTGAAELGRQVMQTAIEPLREAMTDVPPGWWDRFLEKADPDELLELVVPIYDEHLTDAELDALIAFYGSAEGQSLIRKMPVIMQESIQAGQAWGLHLSAELIAELEAEGYEVPPDLGI
jgi:hypothetical protein